MSYEIKLDIFEGPLDLLLYLIKKNEINVYDIPITFITEQYLKHLEIMKSLNFDLAGEYLVLASTLIHIKSKMLLPVQENGEKDEPDPREDIVRQLLEYQAFKKAAMNLDNRSLLGRDVFKRGDIICDMPDTKEISLGEVGVFELVKAFREILTPIEEEELLKIDVDRMSLSDRINEIMEMLAGQSSLTFTDLLGERTDRRGIIYTFLAILELMKSRMVSAHQMDSFGMIRIFPVAAEW